MTLLVTMATKSGIIMGSDSRISMWYPKTKEFGSRSYNVNKIIEMKDYHMAASFWGQIDICLTHGAKTKNLIDEIFPSFITSLSTNDNVDTVSEKFRDYINRTVDFSKLEDFGFGVHMAGYIVKNGEKVPKVRHVCRSKDDDKDYNQKDLSKFKSNDESKFANNPPYAMVFNGFYYIVNALVNWIRQYYGDIYSMFNPRSMSLKQGISFAKYLINITKGFQNYAHAPKLVGGSVRILSIDAKGNFNWHNKQSKVSDLKNN